MVTVIFPGRLESLADIREFVVHAARSAGFNDKDVYAVELAVDEACTNIIEHAYANSIGGEIECTCDVGIEELVITIKDQGKPFDPDIIPEPNFSVGLEELKPRGAGLFIMKKMMDEVKFTFDSKKGNVLRMVKRKSRVDN
jgi:anti-sigma regulatory factor (Ser/Thr protein kinase)